MAYKNTIPKPTDKLRDSQNDILNNFASIKAAFDINHVTFDLADQGKHNYISMPEQAVAPATAAAEGAIYSKQSTLSTVTELFFRRESSGDEIEFTSSLQAANGWTRLPSGILIKWGSDNATGNATITFPVAATIPVFTSTYAVFLTVVDAAATDTDKAVRLISSAAATFDVYCSARSTVADKAVSFQYLAIGI